MATLGAMVRRGIGSGREQVGFRGRSLCRGRLSFNAKLKSDKRTPWPAARAGGEPDDLLRTRRLPSGPNLLPLPRARIPGATMPDLTNPTLWIVALVAFVAIYVLLRAYFAPEALERRRRRRSHGRVVSKPGRPMIGLAVKTESDDDKR